MKRVVIVPVTEIGRFPGMTVIAREGAIAALLGESFESRCRDAFGSDDEFYDAVATGRADLNTFRSTVDASRFASAKIESLNAEARRIEESMNRIASFSPARKLPKFDDSKAFPDQLRA